MRRYVQTSDTAVFFYLSLHDLNALVLHIIYMQNKVALDLQFMNVAASFISLVKKLQILTKSLFIQKVQN